MTLVRKNALTNYQLLTITDKFLIYACTYRAFLHYYNSVK